MTEQVLDILKLVLLALLYLFFARVLWAVWSEVRASGTTRPSVSQGPVVDPSSPTVAAERPPSRRRREVRPPRGRAGRVARLVVLEPKAARGPAFTLDREITIGRDTDVHDHDPRRHVRLGPSTPRIFDHDGQPMVEDLGSTNGSFLNGNRVAGDQAAPPRRPHPGRLHRLGGAVTRARPWHGTG